MIEKYICEECSSDDIEIRAWYNPNTGDVSEFVEDDNYKICFCNKCGEKTHWRYDYFVTPYEAKVYLLRDDETETGGISFVGENLKDFMDSIGMSYDTPVKKIDEALKECGIEPIFEHLNVY